MLFGTDAHEAETPVPAEVNVALLHDRFLQGFHRLAGVAFSHMLADQINRHLGCHFTGAVSADPVRDNGKNRAGGIFFTKTVG